MHPKDAKRYRLAADHRMNDAEVAKVKKMYGQIVTELNPATQYVLAGFLNKRLTPDGSKYVPVALHVHPELQPFVATMPSPDEADAWRLENLAVPVVTRPPPPPPPLVRPRPPAPPIPAAYLPVAGNQST